MKQGSTDDVLETFCNMRRYRSALSRKSAPLPSRRSDVPDHIPAPKTILNCFLMTILTFKKNTI